MSPVRKGLYSVVAALALAAVGPAGAGPAVPAQADWDAARQTVTTADGLRLTYVELGSGEGVPLILPHGYTDNSRGWPLPARFLGERRTPALDLRGHGGSELPACCHGIDSLPRDVEGVKDALGIARADIAGHPLGAMTAAFLAATRPERVNRLVLASAALDLPQAAGDRLWENVPALEHPIDPESPIMLDWYWNPTPAYADFLARRRAERASRPPAVWMGVLAALSATDLGRLASRIAAPTLIPRGDQDGLFGAAEQEALRTPLPGARFETFEGRGHNMLWEVPEEAGGLIAGFLDG